MVKQKKVYKSPRGPHLRVDKTIKAKKVGLRRSKSGKKYYEVRENRSDVSLKRKL